MGVQIVLDALGQGHHFGPELIGERRLLQPAHAVLAGDRATEADRRGHDVDEGGLGARQGTRLGRVIDDIGVGVAIAGVRNVELAGYTQDTVPGERPIAIGRQRFVLIYITAANNPAAAI